MGRTAAGVKGITLKGDDQVVAMHVIPSKDTAKEVLVITQKGYGKRTALKDYRQQKRGGAGIKTANVTAKTGPVVKAAVIATDQISDTDLLIVSAQGQVIRIGVDSVSVQGRSTQGVRVMRPTKTSGDVATFTLWTEVSQPKKPTKSA
jgi:DNA gyrase subunit A